MAATSAAAAVLLLLFAVGHVPVIADDRLLRANSGHSKLHQVSSTEMREFEADNLRMSTQAEQSKTELAELKVFQMNLSWECMTTSDFGSGKFASWACKQVYIEEIKGTGKETKWTYAEFGNIENSISSCSLRVLENLRDDPEKNGWGGRDYHFLTFQELCNPGPMDDEEDPWKIEGFSSGGINDNCGKTFFRILKTIFFDYEFHVASKTVTNDGYKTTATVMTLTQFGDGNEPKVEANSYHVIKVHNARTSTLSRHECASHAACARCAEAAVDQKEKVRCRMTFGEPLGSGRNDPRPLLAIFFESYGLVQMNVHSPHWRKESSDAERRSIFGTNWILGSNEFAPKYISKLELQYDWVNGIHQAIEEDSSDKGFLEKVKGATAVLVSGDINDVAGELRRLPGLLNPDFDPDDLEKEDSQSSRLTPSIKDDQVLRTCCADRDPYYQHYVGGSKLNPACKTVNGEDRLSAELTKNKIPETMVRRDPCEFLKFSDFDKKGVRAGETFKVNDITYSNSNDGLQQTNEALKATYAFLKSDDYKITTDKFVVELERQNLILFPEEAIKGAPRGTQRTPQPQDKETQFYSRYPFTSDMILSSGGKVELSFPDGYVNNENQVYSDHDPVQGTVTVTLAKGWEAMLKAERTTRMAKRTKGEWNGRVQYEKAWKYDWTNPNTKILQDGIEKWADDETKTDPLVLGFYNASIRYELKKAFNKMALDGYSIEFKTKTSPRCERFVKGDTIVWTTEDDPCGEDEDEDEDESSEYNGVIQAPSGGGRYTFKLTAGESEDPDNREVLADCGGEQDQPFTSLRPRRGSLTEAKWIQCTATEGLLKNRKLEYFSQQMLFEVTKV